MNYLIQRRVALAQALKSHGVEAFLVTAPVNVTYLTGFSGDSSYLAVFAKKVVLVSDTRFEAQIKEECPDVDVSIRGHNQSTIQEAVDVLTKARAKTVGVEGNRITVAECEQLKALAPQVTFVPLNGVVEQMRAIKDPSEVERIRQAVKVAEHGFRMFVATVTESDTEKEMVDALEGYVRRCGARGTSFPPIVAVGERGALPHAPPSSRTLGEGSKLLVDWGADLGYKSDLTRTLSSPFRTIPTRRNRRERVGYDFKILYEKVLDAQNAALAAIRPGVSVKVVDEAARRSLAEATFARNKKPPFNLADCFTHGLGHGIGLEIHEAPRVRSNSDDVLQLGMVISIEPGIYIPGWGGIRIEDNVLVTSEGAKLLTTLSREINNIVLS